MRGDRKRTLIVCPGRGSYNKDDLGYLQRNHSDKKDILSQFDAYRKKEDQVLISALDSRPTYSVSFHTRGDNASPLIYACAYSDFLSIDRNAFDVVAITGNSMGWYVALACAGALDPLRGLIVVNTMGTLMQETLIGGQLIYPLVDETWQMVPGRREALLELMAELNRETANEVFISIELGGLLVFAGNERGLTALEASLLPEQGRYPMRLANHAAFHTPLQQPVANMARSALSRELFRTPRIPLVDGRGCIWQVHATEIDELWDYTFGHQLTETYDFSSAIRVALREYAPECIIILGPGNALGGVVAQNLIFLNWNGIKSRNDFAQRQAKEPFLYSMSLDLQRKHVITY